MKKGLTEIVIEWNGKRYRMEHGEVASCRGCDLRNACNRCKTLFFCEACRFFQSDKRYGIWKRVKEEKRDAEG